MPNKSYSEKLQHSNWQRKRLAVLNRADFQCEDCHVRDKMLSVHHCFYVHGREPWEYEDNELRALCEDCHRARPALERDLIFEFKKFLALLPSEELSTLLPDLLMAQRDTKEGYFVCFAADYELVRSLPPPLYEAAVEAASQAKRQMEADFPAGPLLG